MAIVAEWGGQAGVAKSHGTPPPPTSDAPITREEGRTALTRRGRWWVVATEILMQSVLGCPRGRGRGANAKQAAASRQSLGRPPQGETLAAFCRPRHRNSIVRIIGG